MIFQESTKYDNINHGHLMNLLVANGGSVRETLDRFQVGEKARLFVLFDGSACLSQSLFLEVVPTPRGEESNADRIESEGVALILVLEVDFFQAFFDLDLESLGRFGVANVGFFDEEAVIRRISPGGQEQVRAEILAHGSLGFLDRGDDLEFRKFFSRKTRKM